MTPAPKISVILPVFNGERYLSEAIGSVLTQSFRDFELIIINDGSSDRSGEIAGSFRDERIRIISQENRGLIATLNRGIAEARGEYIARIDSDDIWADAEKLEKQIRFMENNPEYSLVGTNAGAINGEGRKIFSILNPLSDGEIRKKILLKNCFVHSSVLFRKQAALECGSYAPDEKLIEDYGLWLRMGRKWKFANLGDSRISYRLNPSGLTQSNNILQAKNSLSLIRKNRNYYPGFFAGYMKWNIKLLILRLGGSDFSNALSLRLKKN